MDHPKPATPRQVQLEGLFAEFVGMGTDRSYGKLGRKHGIEGPELLRHARAFLWPERINSLAIKQNEETSTSTAFKPDADPRDENVNRLHLTRLQLLQTKAMNYLENCTFDKPDTALRMLVESMKLQRDILGLSKDKDEDLRAILLGRLKEMEGQPAPASTGEPEFRFDPNLPIPAAPEVSEDGPEGNPPPPSGGNPAE